MRKELLTFAKLFFIGRERRTLGLVTEEEGEEKKEYERERVEDEGNLSILSTMIE